MLNYKLQNNISELGQNFYGGQDEANVGPSTFYPSPLGIDNDTNEEIFSRKKAWAELEREQDEVKSNIKSLMRKAPESSEIENPLLAQRMAPNQSNSSYRVPQDVMLEKKHSTEFQNVKRDHQAAEPKSKSKEPATKAGRRDAGDSLNRQSRGKSDQRLSKERSNEDLSASSQSKAQQTQKRQWKAPQIGTELANDYTPGNSAGGTSGGN